MKRGRLFFMKEEAGRQEERQKQRERSSPLQFFDAIPTALPT